MGFVVGSIFWSSLVTAVNKFARSFELPENQQNLVSVIIILGFLVVLPFIFDIVATQYEGIKLQSEVQETIMRRYFYYQLINIYVTVGLNGFEIRDSIMEWLRKPHVLVNLLGQTIPTVSLYFCNLVIVKIFVAIPLEMMRPWQLTTILAMDTILDKKKCTRWI